MKTLYFEGAGCAPRGDVPNCRIRTAFHLDNGDALYLELTGSEVTKHSPNRLKCYTNAAHVDHCFYITGFPQYGPVPADKPSCSTHICERGVNFEYCMAEILRFVNSLGASFDAVEVLHNLAGYRVHAGCGNYNYGDEFPYDRELTAKREAIYNAIYDMEKAEREADRAAGTKKFAHGPSGMVYPNFSLWVDEENPALLHLLRHFNGFNKHWEIDASRDDWQATMRETPLGRYGC